MKLSDVAKAAILVLGTTTLAQAEGWTVTNLETLPNRETCMNFAENTFDVYRLRFGVDSSSGRSNWTIGAYDLRGDVIDGLFVCGDEDNGVGPYLVVYNSDDDSATREMVVDQLVSIWDEIILRGAVIPVPGGNAPIAGGGGSATK